MATLIHEVWEEQDENGRMLESLCLAGEPGNDARARLGSAARLVTTFAASSHFEAMTMYYALYARGEYKTDYAWDHQPYPDEWLNAQRRAPAV